MCNFQTKEDMNRRAEEIVKAHERREPRMPRHDLAEVLPLSTPYMIFIDPCGFCNFKCNFCPCNNTDVLKDRRHQMMSLELFQKIIDDLTEFDEKIKIINLHCYGEPLMNKNCAAMLKYAKEKDVAIQVRCTTNGSLFNHDLNRELVESGVDWIRISVNGQTKEDYKNTCGVEFDPAELIKNVKDLFELSRGTATRLSLKTTNGYLKSPEDVARFFDIYEDISDYVYIEPIAHNWGGYDVVFPDGNLDVGIVDQGSYMSIEDKLPVCIRPFIEMSIHSNGEAVACALDWDFSRPYGDVREHSMKELWNSKQLHLYQKQMLDAGTRSVFEHCSKCGYDQRDLLSPILDVLRERW